MSFCRDGVYTLYTGLCSRCDGLKDCTSWEKGRAFDCPSFMRKTPCDFY